MCVYTDVYFFDVFCEPARAYNLNAGAYIYGNVVWCSLSFVPVYNEAGGWCTRLFGCVSAYNQVCRACMKKPWEKSLYFISFWAKEKSDDKLNIYMYGKLITYPTNNHNISHKIFSITLARLRAYLCLCPAK